jgi:hypothetical protein
LDCLQALSHGIFQVDPVDRLSDECPDGAVSLAGDFVEALVLEWIE